MKQSILTFILGIFFLTTGMAQNDYTGIFKANALKISPFEFGRAEFQMSYERYFNNRASSISIIPSFFLKENQEESIEGWQIQSQYRFYLTHLNKENHSNFLGMYNFGFYTGIYALYMDYKEEFQRGYSDPLTGDYVMGDFKKDITGAEGGALIGVQVDITKRILFDFYVGGGIRYTDYTNTYENVMEYYETYNVFDPEYQGVKPKVGFLLGITF